ncbi:hypothetical protein FQR65_LT10375 [Abscondita terminalis]|nr:hypothetical protein FQR65_LT10375 [Abscondita terminalis]
MPKLYQLPRFHSNLVFHKPSTISNIEALRNTYPNLYYEDDVKQDERKNKMVSSAENVYTNSDKPQNYLTNNYKGTAEDFSKQIAKLQNYGNETRDFIISCLEKSVYAKISQTNTMVQTHTQEDQELKQNLNIVPLDLITLKKSLISISKRSFPQRKAGFKSKLPRLIKRRKSKKNSANELGTDKEKLFLVPSGIKMKPNSLDKNRMSRLNDVVLKNILHPVVCLLDSTHYTFSNGVSTNGLTTKAGICYITNYVIKKSVCLRESSRLRFIGETYFIKVHQDGTVADWTAGGRFLQISELHVKDSECADSLSLPPVSKIAASSDDILSQYTKVEIIINWVGLRVVFAATVGVDFLYTSEGNDEWCILWIGQHNVHIWNLNSCTATYSSQMLDSNYYFVRNCTVTNAIKGINARRDHEIQSETNCVWFGKLHNSFEAV